MIAQRLKKIQFHIKECCARAGRLEKDIVLIGVTKYSSVIDIQQALDSGLKDIAENRVQSALEKFSQLLKKQEIRQHLIGHLQTNKVKDAVKLFDVIHSVDSIKLIKEINKRANAINKVQHVLIQLDIAKEQQKFGLPLDQINDMIDVCRDLSNVSVKGLMTMAPFTQDRRMIRDVFACCRCCFNEMKQKNLPWIDMKELSMGMSDDMDIAIEEGSTMLRIGSAIFKD